MPVPTRPKIYHITHVNNLATILERGELLSDAEMIRRGYPVRSIGMSEIKERRLRLPVKCHPGDYVGGCVPFYFCPRSVMLFIIHCANHPDVTYRGGQGPIVHLEADLYEVIDWADLSRQRWAFTLQNAGAFYAAFRKSRDDLADVNWAAVQATDFRAAEIKEAKQAEFLLRESFPLSLIKRIGTYTPSVRDAVQSVAAGSAYNPRIEVRREWYF